MWEGGDMEKGIAATCEILKVRGHVWPNTTDNIQLKAKMDDGSTVWGKAPLPLRPIKSSS